MIFENTLHHCLRNLLSSPTPSFILFYFFTPDCILQAKLEKCQISFLCSIEDIVQSGRCICLCIVQSRFDQYYEKIDRILDKGKVSSRIRFMLRDLMDLKEV